MISSFILFFCTRILDTAISVNSGGEETESRKNPFDFASDFPRLFGLKLI